MVDFDHLGYELNRCGGFLDGIENCIQTCLNHAVLYNLSSPSPLILSQLTMKTKTSRLADLSKRAPNPNNN